MLMTYLHPPSKLLLLATLLLYHTAIAFLPPQPLLRTSTYLSVDQNQYNLPLSSILTNWTATIQPQTALVDRKVILNCVNKGIFVDTLSGNIPRSVENPSLGLTLLEIAGGRDDGVGITIIDGIVENGNAENLGFVEGDSIVKLEVVKQSSTEGMDVLEEIVSIDTECLGYDKLVEAIQSLPPPPTEGLQNVKVTVKRLRRMPKVKVRLQYPPDQNEPDEIIELYSGENLRRAMLTRGVKLNDPLSKRFDSLGTGDCGGERTCATCAVSITKGMDLLNPINIQEKQILEKNPRWRMACRAIVGDGMKEGEMTIRVNPKQWD